MRSLDLKTRKIRLVFYRQHHKTSAQKALKNINAIRDMLETRLKTLAPLNVHFKRMSEEDYFYWMLSKYHLAIKGYSSIDEYLQKNPFVPVEDRAYGYNVIEKALAFPIDSDDKNGQWWKFGETYHRYISALSLSKSSCDRCCYS